MTLIEEAEAMAVRLERPFPYTAPPGMRVINPLPANPDGPEAAALLRRMIEQMRGEGV